MGGRYNSQYLGWVGSLRHHEHTHQLNKAPPERLGDDGFASWGM